jgi:hypothetical protein
MIHVGWTPPIWKMWTGRQISIQNSNHPLFRCRKLYLNYIGQNDGPRPIYLANSNLSVNVFKLNMTVRCAAFLLPVSWGTDSRSILKQIQVNFCRGELNFEYILRLVIFEFCGVNPRSFTDKRILQLCNRVKNPDFCTSFTRIRIEPTLPP